MEEAANVVGTRDISRVVSDYTIGFVRLDNNLDVRALGSGSLVTIGPIHGVLTAAHVADALPEGGNFKIFIANESQADFRKRLIEIEHADLVKIRGKSYGPLGPDLAFIRLSENSVAKLSATNSFFNLLKRQNDVLAEKIPTERYVDALVGIVDEFTKDFSTPAKPLQKEFGGIFYGGEADFIAKSDRGFDLIEFKVAKDADVPRPSSFGGVSGGGLWRFYFDEKNSVVERRLIGVPFFEKLVGASQVVVCDGPNSIYKALIDSVLAKWPEKRPDKDDEVGRDFIRDIIQADLDQGKYREIVTRFPPEPNGYLHIGHAKSIALNFGIAQEFPGRCHLRFDDTNPVKEEQEYIDSIQADVRWLGFDWGKNLFFASDYFDRLYEWAEKLIGDGLAYVDDQTQEEIRLSRGTLTEPGKNSPFRDRSVAENLDLFRRMKSGEFPNGARVLRAKIDMAAGNINLRDPVLYRILHAHHPRTGTKWHIYPSYDYAHGQSDAIEGITHSICTLEFEDHRPLYDWFIEKLPVPSQPHQYEFARLNLTYTLLSKRVLTQLVRDGHVAGWDDPRMPTMAGMRRRGVPPAALREFVKRIGVAKANSVVDVGMLEFCIREELNRTSQRRMGVLRPLKVVIENYPEGQTEELEAINHPDDPSAGTRKITFGRELYIEQDDFMENPPKKFFRLSPGNEVRLRYAYFVKCTGVIKNDKGEVVELRCTYDPATKGGNAPDGRKVKATMHWLPAATSVPAEIRIYNQLFSNPSPDASNFAADLNPNSLEVLPDARIEASVAESNATEPMQFERQGYFVRDKDSTPGKPVFSRTIGLRDTFAKEVAKG